MNTSVHRLDGLNNLWGPLSKDIHVRLRAVLSEPSQKTWSDAFSIILRNDVRGLGLTLWQAVIAVDPSFPRVGPSWSRGGKPGPWSRVPDRALLIRAIEYAQSVTPYRRSV